MNTFGRRWVLGSAAVRSAAPLMSWVKYTDKPGLRSYYWNGALNLPQRS